jgi:hypothetical protein
MTLQCGRSGNLDNLLSRGENSIMAQTSQRAAVICKSSMVRKINIEKVFKEEKIENVHLEVSCPLSDTKKKLKPKLKD